MDLITFASFLDEIEDEETRGYIGQMLVLSAHNALSDHLYDILDPHGHDAVRNWAATHNTYDPRPSPDTVIRALQSAQALLPKGVNLQLSPDSLMYIIQEYGHQHTAVLRRHPLSTRTPEFASQWTILSPTEDNTTELWHDITTAVRSTLGDRHRVYTDQIVSSNWQRQRQLTLDEPVHAQQVEQAIAAVILRNTGAKTRLVTGQPVQTKTASRRTASSIHDLAKLIKPGTPLTQAALALDELDEATASQLSELLTAYTERHLYNAIGTSHPAEFQGWRKKHEAANNPAQVIQAIQDAQHLLPPNSQEIALLPREATVLRTHLPLHQEVILRVWGTSESNDGSFDQWTLVLPENLADEAPAIEAQLGHELTTKLNLRSTPDSVINWTAGKPTLDYSTRESAEYVDLSDVLSALHTVLENHGKPEVTVHSSAPTNTSTRRASKAGDLVRHLHPNQPITDLAMFLDESDDEISNHVIVNYAVSDIRAWLRRELNAIGKSFAEATEIIDPWFEKAYTASNPAQLMVAAHEAIALMERTNPNVKHEPPTVSPHTIGTTELILNKRPSYWFYKTGGSGDRPTRWSIWEDSTKNEIRPITEALKKLLPRSATLESGSIFPIHVESYQDITDVLVKAIKEAVPNSVIHQTSHPQKRFASKAGDLLSVLKPGMPLADLVLFLDEVDDPEQQREIADVVYRNLADWVCITIARNTPRADRSKTYSKSHYLVLDWNLNEKKDVSPAALIRAVQEAQDIVRRELPKKRKIPAPTISSWTISTAERVLNDKPGFFVYRVSPRYHARWAISFDTHSKPHLEAIVEQLRTALPRTYISSRPDAASVDIYTERNVLDKITAAIKAVTPNAVIHTRSDNRIHEIQRIAATQGDLAHSITADTTIETLVTFLDEVDDPAILQDIGDILRLQLWTKLHNHRTPGVSGPGSHLSHEALEPWDRKFKELTSPQAILSMVDAAHALFKEYHTGDLNTKVGHGYAAEYIARLTTSPTITVAPDYGRYPPKALAGWCITLTHVLLDTKALESLVRKLNKELNLGTMPSQPRITVTTYHPGSDARDSYSLNIKKPTTHGLTTYGVESILKKFFSKVHTKVLGLDPSAEGHAGETQRTATIRVAAKGHDLLNAVNESTLASDVALFLDEIDDPADLCETIASDVLQSLSDRITGHPPTTAKLKLKDQLFYTLNIRNPHPINTPDKLIHLLNDAHHIALRLDPKAPPFTLSAHARTALHLASDTAEIKINEHYRGRSYEIIVLIPKRATLNRPANSLSTAIRAKLRQELATYDQQSNVHVTHTTHITDVISVVCYPPYVIDPKRVKAIVTNETKAYAQEAKVNTTASRTATTSAHDLFEHLKQGADLGDVLLFLDEVDDPTTLGKLTNILQAAINGEFRVAIFQGNHNLTRAEQQGMYSRYQTLTPDRDNPSPAYLIEKLSTAHRFLNQIPGFKHNFTLHPNVLAILRRDLGFQVPFLTHPSDTTGLYRWEIHLPHGHRDQALRYDQAQSTAELLNHELTTSGGIDPLYRRISFQGHTKESVVYITINDPTKKVNEANINRIIKQVTSRTLPGEQVLSTKSPH